MSETDFTTEELDHSEAHFEHVSFDYTNGEPIGIDERVMELAKEKENSPIDSNERAREESNEEDKQSSEKLREAIINVKDTVELQRIVVEQLNEKYGTEAGWSQWEETHTEEAASMKVTFDADRMFKTTYGANGEKISDTDMVLRQGGEAALRHQQSLTDLKNLGISFTEYENKVEGKLHVSVQVRDGDEVISKHFSRSLDKGGVEQDVPLDDVDDYFDDAEDDEPDFAIPTDTASDEQEQFTVINFAEAFAADSIDQGTTDDTIIEKPSSGISELVTLGNKADEATVEPMPLEVSGADTEPFSEDDSPISLEVNLAETADTVHFDSALTTNESTSDYQGSSLPSINKESSAPSPIDPVQDIESVTNSHLETNSTAAVDDTESMLISQTEYSERSSGISVAIVETDPANNIAITTESSSASAENVNEAFGHESITYTQDSFEEISISRHTKTIDKREMTVSTQEPANIESVRIVTAAEQSAGIEIALNRSDTTAEESTAITNQITRTENYATSSEEIVKTTTTKTNEIGTSVESSQADAAVELGMVMSDEIKEAKQVPIRAEFQERTHQTEENWLIEELKIEEIISEVPVIQTETENIHITNRETSRIITERQPQAAIESQVTVPATEGTTINAQEPAFSINRERVRVLEFNRTNRAEQQVAADNRKEILIESTQEDTKTPAISISRSQVNRSQPLIYSRETITRQPAPAANNASIAEQQETEPLNSLNGIALTQIAA